MKHNISDFYVRVVPLNKKGDFRITRRTLNGINEQALRDNKKPLLQIILDDDYLVNVELEFNKNKGYVKDYTPQSSLLINTQLFEDLAQDMESNIIYELIDDDDGIWHLSISFQRRL
jgi:hypothetical protein